MYESYKKWNVSIFLVGVDDEVDVQVVAVNSASAKNRALDEHRKNGHENRFTPSEREIASIISRDVQPHEIPRV